MVGQEEDRECGGDERDRKNRRLSMLDPKTDLTAMGVCDLIIRIGMIFGEAGKNKQINDKTQKGQTEGRFMVYLGHTPVIRPA